MPPSPRLFCRAASSGGIFPKLSCDTVFTVCWHTFTLFWLRKTSVIVETFQLSFRVFVCAVHPEIYSFFRQQFPFSFPIFLLDFKRKTQTSRSLPSRSYHLSCPDSIDNTTLNFSFETNAMQEIYVFHKSIGLLVASILNNDNDNTASLV